jgi:serine/threonine protein kinase
MWENGKVGSKKNIEGNNEVVDTSKGVLLKRENSLNESTDRQEIPSIGKRKSLQDIANKDFEPDIKTLNYSNLDLKDLTDEKIKVIKEILPKDNTEVVEVQPQVVNNVEIPPQRKLTQEEANQRLQEIRELPTLIQKATALHDLLNNVERSNPAFREINTLSQQHNTEVSTMHDQDVAQVKALPLEEHENGFTELIEKYKGTGDSGRIERLNKNIAHSKAEIIKNSNQTTEEKFEALDNLSKQIVDSNIRAVVGEVKLELFKESISQLPFAEKIQKCNDLIVNDKIIGEVWIREAKVGCIVQEIGTINSFEGKIAKFTELINEETNNTTKKQLIEKKTALQLNHIQNNSKPREVLGKLLELRDNDPLISKNKFLVPYNNEVEKLLPVDLSVSNKDNLKTFITSFKESTKHDKTFMKLGGLTKNVYDSLDNLYSTVKSTPGDLKAQVDAIDKTRAKIQKFMEQRPESSKMAWMKLLDERLVEMKNSITESKVFKLNQSLTDSFRNFKIDLKNPESLHQLMNDGPMGDLSWFIANTKKEDAIQQIKMAMKDSNFNKSNANTKFAEQVYHILSSHLPVSISSNQNQGILETNKNAQHFTEKEFPFESVNVNGKEYRYEKTIAKGGYGIVHKFTDDEGKSIAIKMFSNNKDAQAELDVHRNVIGKGNQTHPNITNLLGALTDNNGDKYSVMEFVEGTDGNKLNDTISDLSKKNVLSYSDELLVKKYLARGALDGLIQVNEAMGMMHLDFKPGNIFYDRVNGIAKVGDFGNSRIDEPIDLSTTKHEKDKLGTYEYRAPEIMNEGTVDSRTDTHAFGLTLNQIITGKTILNETSETSLNARIISNTEQYGGASVVKGRDHEGNEIKMKTPTELGQIVNSTYTARIEDREKLSNIRNSEFFEEDNTPEQNEKAKILLDKIVDCSDALDKMNKFVKDNKTSLITEQEVKAMPGYRELENNYQQKIQELKNIANNFSTMNERLNTDLTSIEMTQVKMEKGSENIGVPEVKPSLSNLHDELRSKVKVIDP